MAHGAELLSEARQIADNLSRGIIKKKSFQRFFPTYPFGGDGIEGEMLSEALNLVFKHFHLVAKATAGP